MIKTEDQKQLIISNIGFLFEQELIDEIVTIGRLQTFKLGDRIISAGDDIVMMPFVLDGAIKVSRSNDDGEELLLYYIESGDTCAMTLQCCVRKSKSEIKAIALEESTLLMIPIEYMEQWMNKYSSWRSFVLNSYHNRFQELMETVDAIAFLRLDERLDMYLKDQAKLLGTLEINYTHQRIAEDLHSSRVVISRLLKQMEVKGIITLRRNKVILKEF
jgi:CRP/FNR family transcriptional regulator, anaerobic regulatory protein